MTRILFLSPTAVDLDVRRHAEILASLPDVALTRSAAPVEDRLAYVLRAASGVFRRRHGVDLVVTVGTAALAAASVGWRGPVVHIVAGRMMRTEARLARLLARRQDFRLVTSSASIARAAMRYVANVHQVRLLRPEPPQPTMSRSSARQRLCVAADVPLFHIVGQARRGSGHRLALWATSILAFRDPAARVLLTTGGLGDAFVRRFALSTAQSQAVLGHGQLNEADVAAAVDVAICVADGPPDFAALAALRDSGVPIVAMRSLWDRERLHNIPAVLVDETRARVIAAAALRAYDSRTAPDRESQAMPATATSAEMASEASMAARQWSHLLETLVMPGRAAEH